MAEWMTYSFMSFYAPMMLVEVVMFYPCLSVHLSVSHA